MAKNAAILRGKQLVVWTKAYRPFLMGGDVHQPVGIEVTVYNPVSLGRGYKGHLITAPNGRTFVAEATTGAFVGPTFEAVKQDIKTGDPKLMKQQMKDAAAMRVKVDVITPAEFWSMLKCGKEHTA